jgi:hypothetical protein
MEYNPLWKSCASSCDKRSGVKSMRGELLATRLFNLQKELGENKA